MCCRTPVPYRHTLKDFIKNRGTRPLWLTYGSEPDSVRAKSTKFWPRKTQFFRSKKAWAEENELWVDNNKCKNKFYSYVSRKRSLFVRKICSIKQTRPDRMTSFLIEDDWGRCQVWHGLMRGQREHRLLGGLAVTWYESFCEVMSHSAINRSVDKVRCPRGK